MLRDVDRLQVQAPFHSDGGGEDNKTQALSLYYSYHDGPPCDVEHREEDRRQEIGT